MNKLAPPTRWYTPWRQPATLQDDPADLGTAFGLDLSLQEAAAPARPATPRPDGWMRRWAARRRPAA